MEMQSNILRSNPKRSCFEAYHIDSYFLIFMVMNSVNFYHLSSVNNSHYSLSRSTFLFTCNTLVHVFIYIILQFQCLYRILTE